MTESDAYLALNLVPQLGGATVRLCVERFGSAAAILSASERELAEVRGIGRVRASGIVAALASANWRVERDRASSSRVMIITQADPEYPDSLRPLHSPPLALYVAGDAACLGAPSVAMVGTRSPTLYGRERARDFAYRLALSGLTIVSGLARGIDTECAEGALLARGRTVAVIGAALDRLYPPENRELARRIVAGGGAVVSEYPFGRSADRQTFPSRNRIISGLCPGVVCIEAGVTSGTLITADHAMEQGRTVMALPGRVTDPSALGCIKLIQQGARLVACPEDVLDELSSLPPLQAPAAPPPPRTPPPRQRPARTGEERAAPAAPRAAAANVGRPPAKSPDSPQEGKILEALRRNGASTPDAIALATALPARVLGPLLMALEIKSAVRRLPDGQYELRKRQSGPT